ncbi:MAG TPA: diacylglycerol kinase [Cytophagales bacterium]|nr:diacylglycerol kinase [Cytophagales bacterium]HAA21317.1 diacylglycerol kinase [Cytophagales bacterium]HAP63780.1 diacylglycerol kinase [Cytophagales bacterium]
MIRTIIVARAQNGVIGKDNDLVWHLPNDLKHFKGHTKGHMLVMGRKSFESMGMGGLPGRLNMIVTRNREYTAEGCLVFHAVEEALEMAQAHRQKEVYILGGGEIYRQALDKDLVDRLVITEVHGNFEGDTTFPDFDKDRFVLERQEDHPADANHSHAYSFVWYNRVPR